MDIFLPVSTKPLITTYNHHAFAMSILQTNEQYIKWVCNHYIQLSYYPQYGALSFDFYMDYIYCDPVFEREFLADDLVKQAHVNIKNYIVNAIRNQRYVICCVDEYYIPGTSVFQKQHFEHNIMIYGVCNNQVCAAGYVETNGRQHFSYFTVPIKALLQSRPHRVTFLRLRKDYEYRLEKSYIIRQLKQYLNMEPTDPVGAYTAGGHLVGLEACAKLYEYLKADIMEGSRIELRPFYLLRDHNRVMLERMKVLAGGSKEECLLVKHYSEIARNYEMFLLKLIKYNLSDASVSGEKIMRHSEAPYICTKPAASVQYAEDFGRWLEDERTSVYEFVSLLETL